MNSSSMLHRLSSSCGLALLLSLLALTLPWAASSAETMGVNAWQHLDWLILLLTVALCALAGLTLVNQLYLGRFWLLH